MIWNVSYKSLIYSTSVLRQQIILRYTDDALEAAKEDPQSAAQIEEQGEEWARRAGVVLDVSNDGYYTAEKCKKDFLKVCSFTLLFKLLIVKTPT